MKLTLPTVITLFRISLVPILVIAFYMPFPWANFLAATVFALASVSDWADGYLARILKQESAFGAFLDPVADKLMVVVTIILLVQTHPSLYIALPSLIIVAREISISALREWMAELGNSATVKVSFIGKTKTVAQLLSLLLMIYNKPINGIPIFEIGLGLYFLAAILTITSFCIYLRAAWPTIRENS